MRILQFFLFVLRNNLAAPYFTNIVSTTMIFVTYLPVNVISGLVILLFYLSTIRLFLNIKIKYRYRFISGIIFCLLWLFARKIFGIYIQQISEINLLYGSLSSVIVILMWIFYSSMALVFSVEVMYVLHNRNYRYRRR